MPAVASSRAVVFLTKRMKRRQPGWLWFRPDPWRGGAAGPVLPGSIAGEGVGLGAREIGRWRVVAGVVDGGSGSWELESASETSHFNSSTPALSTATTATPKHTIPTLPHSSHGSQAHQQGAY